MRCNANCLALEFALRPLSIWMARLRNRRTRKALKVLKMSKALKGTRPSKMAKAPTPLHQRPLNRRFLNRRFPLRRVMPTWYSSALVRQGSCSPAVQHFLQGLVGKRVFLFGTCGFGESDEYFAQILDRVRAYLPADAQYIGGAMCQGKMGMGVKRRYEGMLERSENAQARMLIDNWNKAQSHPNEGDFFAHRGCGERSARGYSSSSEFA